MQKKQRLLKHVRIDREVKRLPEPLGTIIGKGKGWRGGYWLKS
jgi:hypothetical protein